MTSSRSSFTAVSGLLVFVIVISGCALQSLGIRPSEPGIDTGKTACGEYQSYVDYAQKLQEAYHSRATQNRAWIYVAGILGLGVAAATGGLAVATSVGAGTLGLLAISGGFAGGTFATINNEALAVSYTAAANSIDESLRKSREKLVFSNRTGCTATGDTLTSCAKALPILVSGVSEARQHLEVARTDNAAGALARATDQMTLLKKQMAAFHNASSIAGEGTEPTTKK